MIKNARGLVPLGRSCNVIMASREIKKHNIIIDPPTCNFNPQKIILTKYFSSLNDSTQNSKEKIAKKIEPPTNLCCMEGCVNCVWLEYVEILVKEYEKKGLTLDMHEIFKEIDKDVEDVNVKAYIKFEIKSKLT